MPKKTLPLSSTEVEKAKAKDKLYRLYDGGGLVLNVATTGLKTWYFKYNHPATKKPDMVKLGRYPALSLAEARKKRIECDELLTKGLDPKQHFVSVVNDEATRISNDFKTLCNEWLPTKRYQDTTLAKQQIYIDEIISLIGNKPVTEITVSDCMALLKPLEKKGHFDKLKKIRSIISQVMTYAIVTGRAEQNPTLHLRGVFKTGVVRHNPAILDEPRLAELATAIDNYQGYYNTKQALKYLLYVWARSGEIRHLKWADIDLDNGLWTYTPTKTQGKTHIEMVTPLSRQVIELLKGMKQVSGSGVYVFPSARGKYDSPMSDAVFNQALRNMGFSSTEQTGHGFRAIARTLLEEKFEYDYRIIEMQLGHQVRDSNGRAYNRVTWLDKRREMMQTWADYLDGLKTKKADD